MNLAWMNLAWMNLAWMSLAPRGINPGSDRYFQYYCLMRSPASRASLRHPHATRRGHAQRAAARLTGDPERRVDAMRGSCGQGTRARQRHWWIGNGGKPANGTVKSVPLLG